MIPGLRAPEVAVAQPFPAKPHGRKRTTSVSIRQYSKKEGKAIHCKQGQGKGHLPDAKALESVNTGSLKQQLRKWANPYKPPRTPEKQTGFFNLTDTTSSIEPAQSLGEIRKRLIALAQGSLKILELEVSDEGPKMEEAVIRPSIEAPASINGAPGPFNPEKQSLDGTRNSYRSRTSLRFQKICPIGEVQGRTQNSSMYQDEATLKIIHHKDELAPEEFLAWSSIAQRSTIRKSLPT